MPAFVMTVDDFGIPRYAAFNRPAQKAAGKSEAEVIGKTAEEVHPGGMGSHAFKHHLKAVHTGQTTFYELPLSIQGVRHLIRTVVRPRVDEKGRITHLVGTVLDATAERVLKEVGHAEVDDELEQFIALAAHDLRTPLRNVKMLADMLREDFTDLGDGKIEMIGTLEQVVERAAGLISDVLRSVQTHNLSEGVSEFDLQEVCEDIRIVLDPMGQHKWTLPKMRVLGDEVVFQLVLRNLLDNALKHADRRRISIAVDSYVAEEGQVSVVVRDDGAGFSNPALVFLDTGELRTDSGFGLYGVRRLILRRGGTIRVETPVDGVGAQVTFTLPADVVSEQAQTGANAVA